MVDQTSSPIVINRGKVMQIGTPEEIYHKPTTAFVAEFLGVTNVLRGTASADGKSVRVAGTNLQQSVEPSSPVIVVFKADEANIVIDALSSENVVAFRGTLEEVSFIGTVYRHYVNIGGEMVLIDNEIKVTAKDVRVIVPRDKIQFFST